MKNYSKILFFVVFPFLVNAQQGNPDSLRNALAIAKNDSMRFDITRHIYRYYEETNRDSALSYATLQLLLARRNHQKLYEGGALVNQGYQLIGMGRYAESLQCLLNAFTIAENPQNDNVKNWPLLTSSLFKGNRRLALLAFTHHIFGNLMSATQNTSQEIFHYKEAVRISKEIGHAVRQLMTTMNLGRSYTSINMLDSALIFEKEAEQLVAKSGVKNWLGGIYLNMGNIYFKKGDKALTKQYYYQAIQTLKEQNNLSSLSAGYFVLTKYYLAEGEKDSSLKYAMNNLQTIQSLGPVTGLTVNLGTVYENIYLSYKLGNQYDSTFKYLELAQATKDSLYKIRIQDLADFQNTGFNEQLRLQNIEKEKADYQNKIRTYALLAGIAVFILIASLLYRNNRNRQKANRMLQKQNKEIEEQKKNVEQTLSDLKSAQSQLIQSEKMASLGELTAGIAHEIQNPLNFVNNFSEVSTELVDEMNEKINKGNIEEAKEIAGDLKQNLEKINHHGKRAGEIVKGMLQHSRSSSGVKEPTDINKLADEYLRLAYHGLRAKDPQNAAHKSFNATIIPITIGTDFDETIGDIHIIPQDIGRVILNLINNAFYAVHEREKLIANSHQLIALPYEPTVSVTTKKIGNKVEIKVSDNGNGIPQKILDKIFQPFFTTKPTGQGTGLGLSLSYDIVKAHGGELKVETKEGEGSEFIISLPKNI